MPNRIIKESLCTSDKIAALSDFEFRLWIGMITQADDMGRGDARPAILKGRIFPLRDRVTIKDIDAGIHGLAAKGCVSLYTVGGKPYFWFPTWQKHQRVRDCKAKYPGPEESDDLQESAAGCGNPPQVAAGCGLNPIRIQSESESNPPITPQGAWGDVSRNLLQGLQEFEQMRKKLKKPMTDRAKQLLLSKLRKLSGDEGEQIAILEQSVLHGWQDVYPLKEEQGNGGAARADSVEPKLGIIIR
ncbi:hypothetical protein [Angelakisella massiliensis]|uniref:hypothetical protein n=1 Tax=Angelakisella massiliensis TaxID=1871018 RepID=UPI0023A7C91E|nr:hypothetical protein [Angelakisella massiliensis]